MRNPVDVIVPMHGRPDLLETCLMSLERDNRTAINIVYVVDDSSPEAEALAGKQIALRQAFRVEWVPLPARMGFVGAANVGWARSSSALVVILNNDTVLPPGAISALATALDADPQLAAVAAASDNPRDLFQYRPGKTLDTQTIGADYLTAMCLGLRRSAVGELLFDTAYTPGYFEDLDLSCRLRTRGWQLAITEHVRVRHRGGATFAAERDWRSVFARNYARFEAKWSWLPTHHSLQAALALAGAPDGRQ
jgi:GT2 family glycosyltransferase